MLIKVAWRNIWRNRTRSLVILVAVAIGLWAGIFLMAFYNGMIEQRLRSAIETEISHIQIHHPLFVEDHDLKYLIENGTTLLQTLKQEKRIKAAAGRIIAFGMAATAAGSAGVKINAVNPEDESGLTKLNAKVISGHYFTSGVVNEILISEKMSQKLRLGLRSKMVLTFTDREGNIASGAFRVAGLYKTVNLPYDELNVFVNIRDAGELAGLGGQYNEIALLLHTDKDVDTVVSTLAKTNPSLKIMKWMEISPEMELLVTAMDQMMFIYMGIIMLALAFGIINTMLMSVLERTRELGVLISLGMNKTRIFGMILFETIFLVLAGCPAGIIPAFITIMYTRKRGISLSMFSDSFTSFGLSDQVFPSLGFRQFGIIMALVILTALVSAIFPARRALRLKPAEAIRK